ncbi:hybrid sensor histidine kinase/response regulator transcription factor [Spirosoma fluminis]
MKRIGTLTIGLIFCSLLIQAQPQPLRLILDSLDRDFRGYTLQSHRWQYHAGDDRRWASPSFDDRDWISHGTDFDLSNPPADWNGIGWFRLHFSIDSLPVDSLLAIRIDQVGASEVFLDGQRIGRFGTVGQSPKTGTDYCPSFEPITFKLDRAGPHLLVVRMATFRPYVTRWARYRQGFASWLSSADHMTAYVVGMMQIWSINLVSVFTPSLFGLLHLFLFLVYPTRRSNLYYSLWLGMFACASTCVYFDRLIANPVVIQQVTYGFWLANIGMALSSVVFIYSVCYSKAPRWVWGFYALALLLVVTVLLIRGVNSVPWVFGFEFLCLLEVMRVVLGAMLRRQPGVWLIGMGLLAVGIAIFIGASDVLHIWPDNSLAQNLFLTVGFLTLPLCTSLYLARDFGQTSRNLERQLQQVEDLSAQTRAQEAEKLKLIAGQNEQLERTVRERTDQLQRQTDKLQELDAFKSRFFTNLTHEFRTPLTLILGPAEQVLTHTDDPQTKQQVGLIQRNGNRLLRLINQLLDLSKLEAGKMSLTLSPGDLVSLLCSTLQSFESIANQKGVVLLFRATQKRLIVHYDRDKVEKILYNLLSNAIKFTSAGGTVSLSLTNDEAIPEGWIQLSVQDTGAGIPTAKQPYIFDRFYQADASDTREQEGTGIGLALTKELVDVHGGTIHLSSQEGVGTLVIVCLPMQASSSIGADAEQPKLLDRSTTFSEDTVSESEDAPLVLLIEDNDDVRAFIRSSLSGSESCRVIEASDGEAGLQLAQQQVPDLVITDLMMPRMDGYAVCKRLKQDERTSHIPVIMLTARADLDSKLEGLETGADAYLAKPFSQRELTAHITNLIALRQQLREHYSRERGWFMNVPVLPSMERVFIERVRTAIDNHLDDEQYSVERLSNDVGLSRTQLHRKLKALINEAPGDLIRLLRLQRAHELLSANVGTVAEVAYQVGFSNPANFSTSFSRHFGYAPSEVKNR